MFVPNADRPYESATPRPLSSPSRQSPGGNTGDRLTASSDWFSGTALKEEMPRLLRFLDRMFGKGEETGRPCGWYAQGYVWPNGAKLGWSPDRPECWLSINGQSMAIIGPDRMWWFLTSLYDLRLNCTRLDLALDDYSRELIVLDKVLAAASVGNVVGFRRWQHFRPVRNMVTGELEGETHSFGRRGRDGSGRFVRIYDKGLESNGEQDCIRLEVELSGDIAREFFAELVGAGSVEKFYSTVARIAVGSIDFKDRAGAHGHKDRMVRLDWWQRVIDRVGEGVYAVKRRVVPPLQRTVEYFRDNWLPTIKLALQIIEDGGHDAWAVLRDMAATAPLPKWHQGHRDLGLDVPSLLYT